VGRAKRVSMADLRALFEELGYGEVRTLLNSGNVVFSAGAQSGGAGGEAPAVGAAPDAAAAAPGAAAAGIEEALVQRLGVSARVTVLTAAELATIVAENPLLTVAGDHSRLLVAVLAHPADGLRLVPLTKQEWAPEALALGERVAYLWCPEGVIGSRLNAAVGRLLGDAVTARNWATVTKLHALVGGQPR
jgi:uncharacterized protein (DUF1697 family)